MLIVDLGPLSDFLGGTQRPGTPDLGAYPTKDKFSPVSFKDVSLIILRGSPRKLDKKLPEHHRYES
jgi:hypothetical protein